MPVTTRERPRLDATLRGHAPILGSAGGKDGPLRVDFAPEATPAQRSAALAAAAAFDWSDAAQLAWERAASANAAVTDFLSGTNPAAVAVRIVARRLATWINDERQARGQPRRIEPEVVTQLIADAAAGWGDPITP